VPETMGDGDGPQGAHRVRDTPTHGLLGNVRRYTKLSECWHWRPMDGTKPRQLSPRAKAETRCVADLLGAGYSLVLRFWLQKANLCLLEQKYAQVKSSSVAQGACPLELLDRCCFGRRSPPHFAVARASFARSSGIPFSLRRNIERVVRWCRAGNACNGILRSRLLLLLPATDAFVGRKA
jgi:hypothetical protein